MRDPRVYASALDEYTLQNNYLNNANPKQAKDASSTCTRERVRRVYMENNYLNNS